MYTTTPVLVYKDDPLYEYCDKITHLANNLYNASLFRIRQVMTAVGKEEEKRQANEIEVLDELKATFSVMNETKKNKEKPYVFPNENNWLLDSVYLIRHLMLSQNPDYYAEGLSSQTAQGVVKNACQNVKSWVKACQAYKISPEKFKGKPKLPKYKEKGGNTTVKLTNQDCRITESKGKYFLKLPKTKTKLQLRKPDPDSRLKEAAIIPIHGIFEIRLTFEKQSPIKKCVEEPRRAAFIDLGVRNFASMTNNVGYPSILFKGGIVKSINQKTARETAKIQSEQTKGTEAKFVITEEMQKILLSRRNKLNDYLHKTAKYIISILKENNIDTLIVGANHFWKQDIKMGRRQNQKFSQMPHTKFREILKYLCEREGILFEEHEESYTSQADFTASDYMPLYGKEEGKPVFSGKRSPKEYKGRRKESGFHGLYRTHTGRIINADLNASANIGRKAYPNIFENGIDPDFENVIVIKHPDEEKIKENQRKQKLKYM